MLLPPAFFCARGFGALPRLLPPSRDPPRTHCTHRQLGGARRGPACTSWCIPKSRHFLQYSQRARARQVPAAGFQYQSGSEAVGFVAGCLLFTYLKLRPSELRVKRWRREADVIMTHIREPRSFKYYRMEVGSQRSVRTSAPSP